MHTLQLISISGHLSLGFSTRVKKKDEIIEIDLIFQNSLLFKKKQNWEIVLYSVWKIDTVVQIWELRD